MLFIIIAMLSQLHNHNSQVLILKSSIINFHKIHNPPDLIAKKFLHRIWRALLVQINLFHAIVHNGSKYSNTSNLTLCLFYTPYLNLFKTTRIQNLQLLTIHQNPQKSQLFRPTLSVIQIFSRIENCFSLMLLHLRCISYYKH